MGLLFFVFEIIRMKIFRSHAGQPQALAVLDWQTFYWSTMGLIWQAIVFVTAYIVIGLPLLIAIVFLFFRWLSEVLPQEEILPTVTGFFQRYADARVTGGTTLIDFLLYCGAVSFPLSILHGFTALFLTRGYQDIILRKLQNSSAVIVPVNTADVVTYSLAGAFGLILGKNLFRFLYNVELWFFHPFAVKDYASAGTAYVLSRLADFAMEILTIISTQVFVSLAVARRDVHSLPSNVYSSVFAVVCIRFTLELLSSFWSTKVMKGSGQLIITALGVGLVIMFSAFASSRYAANIALAAHTKQLET